MWYNGDEYFYIRNLQGDIIALVYENGTIAAKYSYDAWGNHIAITDGNDNDVSGDPYHIANINPYRYRGYRYDTETGLYCLQSRYYDPEVGRFINADGMVSTGMGILGHNMFAYCNNNPVVLVDPSGTCPYNGTVADFHRLEQGLPSINCTCSKSKSLSISDFKNADGSYSLYDNRRHSPDSVFHEQILSAKVTKPSASLKNGKLTLGSYKVTLMTGGWEWKHIDLSLLDIGSAKVALGVHENQFEIAAMATIWDPSITFKFSKVKISLTANVGSVGAYVNVSKKSVKAAGALGWGAGISIDWE